MPFHFSSNFLSSAISPLKAPTINPFVYIAACSLLGAFASLAFAPVNFWPAIIIAQVALLYFLQPQGFFITLLGLWAFWAFHFGTAMYWVYIGLGKILGLGAYSAVLLTIVTGLIYSAILLLPWFLYARCPPGSLIRLTCFPLAWVLCEWMRYWILGGLTWLFSGYGLLSSWLAGWIPVFGAIGASFAASISAVLLFIAIRRKSFFPLIATFLIWATGGFLSIVEWTHPVSSPIPVTIVQPEAKVWLQRAYSAEERDQLWNQEIAELSQGHWQEGLLIWPERGLRTSFEHAANRFADLEILANASNTALITGGNFYDQLPDTDFLVYNSIYGFGAANGRYHKEKLAPLGERNLLGGFLGIFSEGEKQISTKITDPEARLIHFEYANERFSIASLICYEIAWGNYLNSFAGEANILVNLSNDRWFYPSPELEQTLQIAQVRALEQQKPLLRSAFGGFSANINYRGEIMVRAADTSAQIIRTSVEPRAGQTPYSRFGDLPILLIAMLIWLTSLILNKFRRPDTSGNQATSAVTNG